MAKELDRLHDRSVSESGLIHYARLQDTKMKAKDRKAAKKAAKKEAMKSMQNIEREKTLRKD